MTKATHIVLIDADFDKALEVANLINGQNFTTADEALKQIKVSLGVKSSVVGICIYELDNFRRDVNNGDDMLTDVFICFISLGE